MAVIKPFDKIEIIRKCTGLSSTQKLILLIIASHLGKQDLCYISFNTLQEECCLKKRNAVSDNLKSLIDVNILWKIPPSDGFKSNRYGINFNLLVTNGYQCGNPRLPDRYPTVTRVVTNGYPKRKINKSKEIKRANLVDKNNGKAKAENARKEIAITCGFKRH